MNKISSNSVLLMPMYKEYKEYIVAKYIQTYMQLTYYYKKSPDIILRLTLVLPIRIPEGTFHSLYNIK